MPGFYRNLLIFATRKNQENKPNHRKIVFSFENIKNDNFKTVVI